MRKKMYYNMKANVMKGDGNNIQFTQGLDYHLCMVNINDLSSIRFIVNSYFYLMILD
jgi:hypothetical protein